MVQVTIGIDASNLLQGGGRTHLIEVIGEFLEYDVRVFVWGKKDTLDLLPCSKKMVKISNKYIEGGWFQRFYWQTVMLSKELANKGCDILFSPGGNYLGGFRPYVTMSRNMLPFEKKELNRYFPSTSYIKLLLLKYTQVLTFKRSSGVVFLSQYARDEISKIVSLNNFQVIPHGVNQRFNCPPRKQYPISNYNEENKFRILYVSSIDVYKHQWNVIEAVHRLKELHGWAIELILCGPSTHLGEKKLKGAMIKYDSKGNWVDYRKSIPYLELSDIYRSSHLAIFASTCENMPNTLVEYMSAGLPIVSSNYGPMREVLGAGGGYFDPENIDEILKSLEEFISDENLRARKAAKSYNLSKDYSWKKCAESTFQYINSLTQ